MSSERHTIDSRGNPLSLVDLEPTLSIGNSYRKFSHNELSRSNNCSNSQGDIELLSKSSEESVQEKNSCGDTFKTISEDHLHSVTRDIMSVLQSLAVSFIRALYTSIHCH